MTEKLCAICQRPLHNYSIKYYCKYCYQTYGEQIKSHAPWVMVAYAEERKVRFQDSIVRNSKRIPIDIVYLGSDFDVAPTDNDYRLIKLNYEESEVG